MIAAVRSATARAGDAAAVRCVVLDRDGTLIRYIPYLSRPNQVELLPTVRDGLRTLRDAGCKLFLHTNQSGIGRGYFSYAAAMACTREMIEQIGLGEDLFERICIAPEAPDEASVYRKPSPTFGQEILRDYAIGTGELCYVGDNVSDLLTAVSLDCEGVGVTSGVHDLRRECEERAALREFPVFDTFGDAATYVARTHR